MSTPALPTPEHDLTPEDAARLAGRSVDTVYRHIAAGKLKAHRIGGQRGPIWISQAELYAWLGAPARPTPERLNDTDWSTPDPGRLNPHNDIVECGEHTAFLPVHASRLIEFGAKRQELGQ